MGQTHQKDEVSLGQWLQQRRRERNVSIAEIEAATKIRRSTIEALETDQYYQIPLPYLRSIVRTIGHFLQLPAEEVEQRLRTLSVREDDQSGTASVRNTGRSSRWRWWLLGLIVGGTIGIIFWLVKKDTGDPLIGSAIRDSDTPLTVAIVSDTVAVKQRHRMQDTVIVQAYTVDSVWISIEFDNAQRWQELLPPGQHRVWGAKQWLKLSVGNAGGLYLIVNADTLGPLGKPGVVLRAITITPSGIEGLPTMPAETN